MIANTVSSATMNGNLGRAGIASPIIEVIAKLTTGDSAPTMIAQREPSRHPPIVSGLFSKKIYDNGLWAFPAVLLAQFAGRTVFLGLVAIFQNSVPFTVPMIWSQILTGWVGLLIQVVLVPLLIIGLRAILKKDND